MTVLSLQIDASTDDAFEYENGFMDLTSFNTVLGHVSIGRHCGFRFAGVSGIYQSTIDAATLTFRASVNDSGNFIGDWYADDRVDPSTFTSTAYDISSRTRTDATCEGDGSDFGAWTGGQDETFSGPGVGIKGIIQELADDYDPAEIALLHIYVSNSGERLFVSYNGASSTAPKLSITFTEGGPAPVTGQANLTGIGALAAAAGVTIPASVAFSGVGSVSAAGNIGSIHEAAAVMSGVGSLTPGTPVLTLVGQASILGEGSLVAVGERGALGAAVLSGVGSLAGVGQVGNLVEGYVSFAGVGSMSALAQKLLHGQLAISGAGSLAPVGVVTVVGVATLSGIGTLSAIGETGETLFTIFGPIRREIDPNDYPAGTEFRFEVILGVEFSGTARARLYNITDAAAVADSELTTSVFGGTRLLSPVLTLPNSAKLYRAEYGGTPGNIYTIYSAAMRVESA